MLRLLKRFSWAALLAAGVQCSSGFVLIGPPEPWEVPEIAYMLPGDIAAPHNLGEEFRRNVPVVYYGFDASFLDYFGSNGVYAVDQAFALLNSLTNRSFSQYSRDLHEFPLYSTRENYEAEALNLIDLKSITLATIVEKLGLLDPTRYVWGLHDRYTLPGGSCPAAMVYLVVQRNFDPVPSSLEQYQGSPFINDVLYSYYLTENCGQGGPPSADAITFQVDPLDITPTAVADLGIRGGGFYTGLTRDDMGGLRYLMQASNANWEDVGTNSLSLVTNPVPQLIVTSNLTLLADQSLTNDAATLQGLYPGLIIASTTNSWTNVYQTNIVSYYTNSPYAPARTPPTLVLVTNLTLTVQTLYHHLFANVLMPIHTNGGWVTIPVVDPFQFIKHVKKSVQTIDIKLAPQGAAGISALITNVSYRTIFTNEPAGEFFLLPSNWCDVQIIARQITFTNVSTNVLIYATNVISGIFSGTNFTGTNAFGGGGTNNIGASNVVQSFEESLFDYQTTHGFIVYPVLCQTGMVALTEGIDHISFARQDYDSLMGRFFEPITNRYVINIITNNAVEPITVVRVLTQPDLLFTAADMAATPDNPPTSGILYRAAPDYDTNGAAYYNGGTAGPGVIVTGGGGPGTIITFNKVGAIWGNAIGGDQTTQTGGPGGTGVPYVPGSFDGSTNPPVVFPNGATVESLEAQMVIHLAPDAITNVGYMRQSYSVTLQVSGGEPPYKWSLAPTSAELPYNLSLAPTGPDTAAISGKPEAPTQPGTYDFTIRLSDAGNRIVDRPYSITIKP